MLCWERAGGAVTKKKPDGRYRYAAREVADLVPKEDEWDEVTASEAPQALPPGGVVKRSGEYAKVITPFQEALKRCREGW